MGASESTYALFTPSVDRVAVARFVTFYEFIETEAEGAVIEFKAVVLE